MRLYRTIPRIGLIATLGLLGLLSPKLASAQNVVCDGGALLCSDYADCVANTTCECKTGYVTGVEAVNQFTTCDDPNTLKITPTSDAATLAAALGGSGITISNGTATYSGASAAPGTFAKGPLGMGAGILLTSGDARLAPGPNEAPGLTGAHEGAGHQRCKDIVNGNFVDGALLSFKFDLDAQSSGVCFDYMFGSEEYPEYVGQFNDVAGVFLDGINVGLDADGDPITINGPFFSGTQVVTQSGTEYDGSTPRLRICKALTAGEHTMEIVVCDATDAALDSAIFVSNVAGYTGTPPALTWCGDGNQDVGEECDDGNTVSGDTCTSDCKTASSNCGNGTLDSGETCDDNDPQQAPGDGCDSLCQTEPGWTCLGAPSVCTKNPVGGCSSDPECNDNNPCTVDECVATACVNTAATDSDGDTFCDAVDGCPQDQDKVAGGACGCGTPDVDTDGDQAFDCLDACPNDPLKVLPMVCGCNEPEGPQCVSADLCPTDSQKTEPGLCGCGTPDTDKDGDKLPDCNDDCPRDSDKTAPGLCGCNESDDDSDKDGVPDCNDGCPDDAGETDAGACECTGEDADGDGEPDCTDQCPSDPDKTEAGTCGCGTADSDRDGDGVLDCEDQCPRDERKDEPGACGCGAPEEMGCGKQYQLGGSGGCNVSRAEGSGSWLALGLAMALATASATRRRSSRRARHSR